MPAPDAARVGWWAVQVEFATDDGDNSAGAGGAGRAQTQYRDETGETGFHLTGLDARPAVWFEPAKYLAEAALRR